MNIFCLIRDFKFYVLGIGNYFKETNSGVETKHNHNTSIVEKRNLIDPIVRASEIFE